MTEPKTEGAQVLDDITQWLYQLTLESTTLVSGLLALSDATFSLMPKPLKFGFLPLAAERI